MNFNSPLVQWILKVALSKAGPFILAAASWCGLHIVTALGLPACVDHDSLAKIQDGLSTGIDMVGMSLLAAVYAFVAHRQSQGVKIAKAMVVQNPLATPGIDQDSGAIGNATLSGLAKVTGISIERAAAAAGVKLPDSQ